MKGLTQSSAISGDFRLTRARAPAVLLPPLDAPRLAGDLIEIDLLAVNGRISALAPSGQLPSSAPQIDLDHGIVLPRLVDIHTHLDKGQILARAQNADHTHGGARTSVAADREANWNAADVRARMDFALRCAFAHGAAAIRTHIDSLGAQAGISWPVFEEIRADWKGRIDIQAVALLPVDIAVDDEPQFKALVARVARAGGLLGGLAFPSMAVEDKSRLALARVFEAAAANGLDLDFHVDESGLLSARGLREIADMAIRTRFPGRIVAGHCCSLALHDEAERNETIARVAEAGVAVVSLPMCNMYLQDRTPGRTPRWRGVTAARELAAAGVKTMFAGDNTRDPFYAYGDLDMIEVVREATRIVHLEGEERFLVESVSATPAAIMGLPARGRIAVGDPVDLILFRARNFNELNCRPQADRVVIAAGQQISTTPPDYRELDAIVGPA